MAKFRVKLKITGFELELEGSREDLPLLAENIGAQLAGFIAPAAGIAAGESPALGRDAIDVTPTPVVNGGTKSRRRGARKAPAGAAANGAATATTHFDFKHNVEAWGTPVQGWSTADKAIWLLYVAKQQGIANEMTAPQITNTFNRLFKQAGAINDSNLRRDFGKLKATPPAKVADDGTKTPAPWYLNDAGTKHAEGLVIAARGGTPTP